MSKSTTTNFLQLPVIGTFEPLTKGTDLPSVPPSPAPSSRNSIKDAETETTQAATGATTPPHSPVSPQSPTGPGSVRRFLSRVSLNSNYDKEQLPPPPMSPTSSIMSFGKTASTTSKKISWWRRGKNKDKDGLTKTATRPQQQQQQPQPQPQQQQQQHYLESIAQRIVPTRPLTPPPKLPEVNGTDSTFEEDLFKSIK